MDKTGIVHNVVVGIFSRERGDGVTEYLLIKSRKNFGKFTGFWYPPGGHIEKSEDEEKALIREIKEELGLIIKPIKKISTTPGDVNQLTHWWKGKLLSSEMRVNKDEIVEVGWFTKEEMDRIKLFPATCSFFKEFIFT